MGETELKCPKCRQKMESMEGRVEITLGETVLSTTADAWRCDRCDLSLAQLQVKVQPLRKPMENVLVEKMQEGEGHA